MPERLHERVARAIESRIFPGCVVGFVRADGTRGIFPFGGYTYEVASPRVAENTVYDLASITKSIPTASLALRLIEDRRMSLSDTVVSHVPDLQNHHDATIEDLLRYRVRGVRLSALKDKTAGEIRSLVLANGFERIDTPEYSNLPALLLGWAIESAGDASLDELADKLFFAPLRMTDTSFFLMTRNCAPTEIDEWRGEVQGLPHDESAYVFARSGIAAGHAGLFSTTPDLLHFLEALLRGSLPYVVTGGKAGLGWQREGDMLGSTPGSDAFGKTGFTGTSVVCDPGRGIAFSILSNRTYPKRPLDGSQMNEFRKDIADILCTNNA